MKSTADTKNKAAVDFFFLFKSNIFLPSCPVWMGFLPNKNLTIDTDWSSFVFAGMQKSLRSDFDMAYERGRISVSAEDGNTPPTFTRVSRLQTLDTHDIRLT